MPKDIDLYVHLPRPVCTGGSIADLSSRLKACLLGHSRAVLVLSDHCDMHTGLQASNDGHLQGEESSERDVCRGNSESNFGSQGCCRDFQVTHDFLPIVSAMSSDIFEERGIWIIQENASTAPKPGSKVPPVVVDKRYWPFALLAAALPTPNTKTSVDIRT